jgi:phosphoribosylglycinamide formyltransferase-1
MDRIKLAVLVSGYGSTLANLCGQEDFDIVLVASQNTNALPVVLDRKLPFLLAPWDELIFKAAHAMEADLIICAGWTKLLKVPPLFAGRILNIHPSLLPKFGGKGMYGSYVHAAVLRAKETISGCTVHVVDDEYDHGEIIAQGFAKVLPDDTVEKLQARVQSCEREFYPIAIRKYWSERCKNKMPTFEQMMAMIGHK